MFVVDCHFERSEKSQLSGKLNVKSL